MKRIFLKMFKMDLKVLTLIFCQEDPGRVKGPRQTRTRKIMLKRIKEKRVKGKIKHKIKNNQGKRTKEQERQKKLGRRKKGAKGKKQRRKKKKAAKNKKQRRKKKKGAKNKSKRKSKKDKRTRKKNAKKSNANLRQQYTNCTKDIVAMSKMYTKAGNYKRQIKRVQRFAKISVNKGNKSADFKTSYGFLLNSTGGNASAPTCNNVKLSRNATANVVTDMKKLGNCEKDIATGCNKTRPALTNTTILGCEKSIAKFTKAYEACLKITDEKICTCMSALNKTDVTACDVSSTLAAEIKAKDKCKVAFGLCRKAEDAAVQHVGNCKPEPIRCGGVTSKSQAEADLAALDPLSTSLKAAEAKTAANFAAAGLRATTRSDTQDSATPAGLAAFATAQAGRTKRQATGCDRLAGEWHKFNKSADSAAKDSSGDLNKTAAGEAKTLLDGITNSATQVDDLKSCPNATRSYVLIIIIRYYIWHSMWWFDSVINVRITILSIIVGKPPPITTAATATAAANTTTAAAATVGYKRKFIKAKKTLTELTN